MIDAFSSDQTPSSNEMPVIIRIENPDEIKYVVDVLEQQPETGGIAIVADEATISSENLKEIESHDLSNQFPLFVFSLSDISIPADNTKYKAHLADFGSQMRYEIDKWWGGKKSSQ